MSAIETELSLLLSDIYVLGWKTEIENGISGTDLVDWASGSIEYKDCQHNQGGSSSLACGWPPYRLH